MKFAFCLFRYFPFGGLQRDFIRIAEECLRRGHTVDVYTMRWEGDFHPDFNITVIPTLGWQNHTRARHFVAQLKPYFAQQGYDLIVGFNKMPGLDVYYAADTCYQAKTKQKSFFYRLTPRYRHLLAYEQAVFAEKAKTHILLISAQQQPEFIACYKTAISRLHLLPPGIAKDRIAPPHALAIRQQTRKTYNIKDDEFLLLMVGSGFKTKGLDRIILGLAALPTALKNRCQLFIIGKDHEQPFKKLAEYHSITHRTHFLGGRNDVANFLLSADLLLHPAYNENTGTVLLEAIISGLPVLTTDVCGYAHYINDAHAGKVLSSPFQQKEFNLTLENMLLSPEAIIWRNNGIAYAKQADIFSLAEQATTIIESLAKNQ